MGILKEFKAFAMRGNVVDLAVALIIGAEFGKIVSSLVSDIIMPPIGKLLSGLNFTDLYVALDGSKHPTLAAAKEAGAPLLTYGNFIQAIVNFVIVAFAVFMIIKAMNAAKRKNEEEGTVTAPAATPEDIQLLREIRDSLKK
ncbi:MAG: large conductance mechanosensitive channel protein MscL [Bacteroidia bacterium]